MEALLKPLTEFTLSPEAPVSTQVLSALRSTILFGEFKPGRRLSEQETAKLMQVSRQPVREAFIRLAAEGLVEIRPQRGTFVSKISIREVYDSRFVRESVEADLVRLAARNITPEMSEALEEILTQQRSDAARDPLHFMGLDEALHRTLAEAAGKPQIWTYLQKLKSQLDRVRFLVAVDLPIEELIAQHEDIVRAVAQRNEEEAERAMRLHLRQILKDLPKIAETYPDYFSPED
ncbi:GntR family transcriptional regulator [Actibacterium sp. MT2.3-13A]|uniref:GntR family transcriptional regulator n=1 Tax=Actibacterium sp. MT2.3-13A TaxID=2828332 RepID=UPI001BA8521D|nr:GntR family transcriptional regulator [Actibacterium sp. MT2.3-13A]